MADARDVEDGKPLLSISIPTYNRELYLMELLACLEPQLAAEPLVELIISDNASEDMTEAMVATFIDHGLRCRYVRNRENLGPDANFLQCLDLARGKYVWVLGDDDLLAPNAVPDLVSLLVQGEETQDFDLVYLSSFGFSGQYAPPPDSARQDRLGRFAEVVTDGAYFLNKVNALIGLISVVIVNKSRLLATAHAPIETLNDSNLLQVGWIFPLLHRRCRVLYVWERLLAYRSLNSGGWGVCDVFGRRLHRIASEYFAEEPRLARSLMNGVLRFWMPEVLMVLRRGKNTGMHAEAVRDLLQPVFAGNWRYWLFVWLIDTPPFWFARIVHPFLRAANKLYRAGEALVRHMVAHDAYLEPTGRRARKMTR